LQSLRDWYRYLERQMQVSLSEEQDLSASPDPARLPHPPETAPYPRADPPRGRARSDPAGIAEGKSGSAVRDAPAEPMLAGEGLRPLASGMGSRQRRGGRRPITETREEIIRRVLDPELTLHEAAAILRVSKATLRRYTAQGRLTCRRTKGGQRRFRLSALLTFLDRRSGVRNGG